MTFTFKWLDIQLLTCFYSLTNQRNGKLRILYSDFSM